MAEIPKYINTWQMVEPGDPKEGKPGKLEKKQIPVPELKEGEVLVKIAGCGVCHTDIGYFYEGVPTVTKPPLTLGHEISGVVVAGDEKLVGKEVIIPAVMPCNNCEICKKGRENRCLNQKMPGNSLGIYGGYSDYIPVPSQDLCVVEKRDGFELAELAVIADAVTTPYQAAVRADLKEGDNVIIIGATGGVGVYMTQVAKAFGANEVIAVARNEEKLQRALKYGATRAINTTGKSIKDVRNEFRSYCKEKGLPSNYGWVIFECTGSKYGQELALELLHFIGKLVVVGFGMHKVEFMLSRLMAFDADVMGTWGCKPKYYKNVLDMVLEGKIQIKPFIEIRPMSKIMEAFEEYHSGKHMRRIVLTPDFE